MTAEFFIVVGSVAASAVLAGVLLWQARKNSARQKVARELTPVRHVSIGDAAEGSEVRLAGTLRYIDETAPLVAPITGRPCSGFQIKVTHHEHSRGNVYRRSLEERCEVADFLLDDGTGEARVMGASVRAWLVPDAEGRSSNGPQGIPEELRRYCHERGLPTKRKNSDYDRELSYVEGLLAAGETVTVVGRARWVDGPHGRTLFVEERQDRGVVVTDDPKLV